jgi:hypothetical protein
MANRSWRDARPVFVVGVPRSGTTLLYRMLLSHPSFAFKGANFAESRAVTALRDFDGRGPGARSLTAYLRGEDLPDEVRAVAARLRLRRRIVRKLARRASMRPGLWALGGEHLVVRAYFAAAADAHAGQRLVEKTPEHLSFVRHLQRAFPQARFVCIHRHPVEVLGSHWERYARLGEGAEWAAVTVEQIAERWQTGVETAEAHRRRSPDSMLVIRYEDLVSDTRNVAEQVLHFLGERFDEACLLQQGLAGEYPMDPKILDPITANDVPWEERVDADDAARLEAALAAPMAMLGYEPVTGLTGRSTPAS